MFKSSEKPVNKKWNLFKKQNMLKNLLLFTLYQQKREGANCISNYSQKAVQIVMNNMLTKQLKNEN